MRFVQMFHKTKKEERMFQMDEIRNQAPRMMTIRQVAATKILPENALRQMVRNGTAPHIMCGTRALINYDKLVQMLEGC